MIIHKHLIQGYSHAVKVMAHNMQLYNEKNVIYASHLQHQKEFNQESEKFLRELKQIQDHNAIELNELTKLRRSIKLRDEHNEDYFTKSIIILNQSISDIIHLIPKAITEVNQLQNNFSEKRSEEARTILKEINNHLQTIIARSTTVAETIKNNTIHIEQEIKWLEKEEDIFKKIKHNINSWFL